MAPPRGKSRSGNAASAGCAPTSRARSRSVGLRRDSCRSQVVRLSAPKSNVVPCSSSQALRTQPPDGNGHNPRGGAEGHRPLHLPDPDLRAPAGGLRGGRTPGCRLVRRLDPHAFLQSLPVLFARPGLVPAPIPSPVSPSPDHRLSALLGLTTPGLDEPIAEPMFGGEGLGEVLMPHDPSWSLQRTHVRMESVGRYLRSSSCSLALGDRPHLLDAIL